MLKQFKRALTRPEIGGGIAKARSIARENNL